MEKKPSVPTKGDKIDVTLGNQKPKPNIVKVDILPPPPPKPKKDK